MSVAFASSSIAAPAWCSPTDKRYYIDRRLRNALPPPDSDSFQSYFAILALTPTRDRASRQFLHRQRDLFLPGGLSASLPDILISSTITARKRPASRSGSGRSPAPPGRSPIPSRIWLLENWPQVDAYDIEIVGSDIDTRALKAAEDGIYGERSLMRLPRDARRPLLHGDRRRTLPDRRGTARLGPVQPGQPDRSRTWRAVATSTSSSAATC